MEIEEGNQENQANRTEQGASKRRLTMQEYEDQFDKRMLEEI